MKSLKEENLKEYFRQNEIKVIALDLDRTTLRSDSTLAPRTRAAIMSAIETGIEVVVISGRPRCSLPQSILEIPGIRYLVTSNGAAVNKRYNGGEKRVWAWTLGAQAVLDMLTLTLPYYRKEKLTYETFVEGIAYASEDYVNHPTKYGAPQKAVTYVKDTRIPVDDLPAFIREHAAELDSFDMLIGEQSCFEEVKALIAENVSDIYMTSSMKRMLEISNKNAGKASGLRYVLDDMGLKPEHAIAFGDGNNDADMLAFAGLGVAMANGMPLCLESADYIGKSNDEEGVAEVLEWIVKSGAW